MDSKELASKVFALTAELSALEQKIDGAAAAMDVDELQKLLPRRSALNHAIVAGESELDELMTAASREQARLNAERSRAQAGEAAYARQREFNIRAAKEMKQRVAEWQDRQVNLPLNGRGWFAEQERLAQAELDRLVTQWNIKEEEL